MESVLAMLADMLAKMCIEEEGEARATPLKTLNLALNFCTLAQPGYGHVFAGRCSCGEDLRRFWKSFLDGALVCLGTCLPSTLSYTAFNASLAQSC